MSHTFHPGSGDAVIYDPDLSGPVTFIMRNPATRGPGADREASVHGTLLRAFIAHYLRSRRVDRIEQMTDEEILS